MRNKVSAPDERIPAYRRAAKAMARGQFRPPFPDVVVGAAADEIDRLGSALWQLGIMLERRFAEADALIRLGERVNAGLLLEEVLDQIFDAFRSIVPYDRIGCSMLEDEGRIVRAVWTRSLGAKPKLGVGTARHSRAAAWLGSSKRAARASSTTSSGTCWSIPARTRRGSSCPMACDRASRVRSSR